MNEIVYARCIHCHRKHVETFKFLVQMDSQGSLYHLPTMLACSCSTGALCCKTVKIDKGSGPEDLLAKIYLVVHSSTMQTTYLCAIKAEPPP